MTEGRDEVPNGDVCATKQQNGNTHHLEGKTRANKNSDASEKKSEDEKFIPRIKWPDLAAQLFIHIGCAYGLYLCFYSRFYTSLFGKLPSGCIISDRFIICDNQHVNIKEQ